MSAGGIFRFAPDWLALRENADAAARSTAPLEPLWDRLRPGVSGSGAPGNGLVVHDLGCGTGSMGRWLAPRLPVPQHWILHDRDPALLARATARPPPGGADADAVTVEGRRGELEALRPADFAGASLVTASALLDVMTGPEVDRVAIACAGAGCPALFTLSVVGTVQFDPADPLDGEIGAAFNAHQRRRVERRNSGGARLLGPDAVVAATEAFERRGATVLRYPSPWRLDGGQRTLIAEWLRGWVAAARAQRAELSRFAGEYLRRRLAACAAGELRVVVGHEDLLVLPGPAGQETADRGSLSAMGDLP